MIRNFTQNQNQDVIEEIKNRVNIVDVVSEYVVLKKSGKNFWGLCPFHQEKSPSFSVNPEKNIFKCFGCGVGGDFLSFLMKINNSTFYEVIVELAQKFGLEMSGIGQSSEKNELKKKIYEINIQAAEYYTNLLLEEPEGKKAKEYLFARGFDREVIQKFNLGYSTRQSDGLINYLINKCKTSFELLEKAGLVSSKADGKGYSDRFRNRLMIPIQDDKGNFIAFGARVMEDSQNPKYLNTSETLVYNKSRSLFALYQAKESIRALDSVIIMEGYFDVISAHIHGLTNVVATSGTALTDQHIKLLAKHMNSRRIYLAFDADDAGINATNRGAEIIKSVFAGLGNIKQFDENFAASSYIDDRYSCEIRVVATHTGKDPDEFIRVEGIEAYKKLVNQAPLLIDYQINMIIKSRGSINTPQDKSNLVKELIPILSEIKNSIIRSEYIRLIAEKLEVKEESLVTEVKKTLQNVRFEKNISEPAVTKKLEKHILAQKNLLSLYFVNSDNQSLLCINDGLKEVMFTEPNFLLIKNEIENIISKVNNSQELSDALFVKLAENEEAKQVLTDILFSLEDKKDLKDELMQELIIENIAYINSYSNLKEQNQLQSAYHIAKDDDLSAIQLQYKVKEFTKSIRNRLETIND